MNKMHAVDTLTNDVYQTLSAQHGEDVIEDNFVAIETTLIFRQRYDQLCLNFSRTEVNKEIARYVKKLSGMNTVHQVPAQRSTIIGSYSKLSG